MTEKPAEDFGSGSFKQKYAALEKRIDRIEILGYLERREVTKMLGLARGRRLPAGTVLFKEGDRGDRFYLIIEGRVRIWKQGANSEETLTVLESGACLGEMSFLDRSARSASAAVVEEATVFEILNQDFLKLIHDDDTFGKNVLWAFCMMFSSRLRQTNRLLTGRQEP